MKSRWLLGILLAGYGIAAVAYMFATPLWEAPDEPAHYLYAEYLALNNHLPPPTPPLHGRFFQNNYAASGYEWYQPPLYYGAVALVLKVVRVFDSAAFPQSTAQVDPRFPQTVNLFIPLAPGQRLPCQVALGPCAARLFSIPLGMVTLIAVWKLAALVSKGNAPLTFFATAFVAFLPQFTFLTSHVTNDNLSNTLAALSLWIMARWMWRKEVPSSRAVITGGLLVALGLITKFTLAFLVPLGWLSLWLSLPQPRTIWHWIRAAGLFTLVAVSLMVLGLLFVPLMQQQLLRTNDLALKLRPQYLTWEHIASLWPLTINSFWGRFGWMNISLPSGLNWLLTAGAALGLVGSIGYQIQKVKLGSVDANWMVWLWIICGVTVASFVRFNFSDFQPQGRYLFPALSALATIFSLGWLNWLSGKAQIVVCCLLVVGMVATNVFVLWQVLLPAYAP